MTSDVTPFGNNNGRVQDAQHVSGSRHPNTRTTRQPFSSQKLQTLKGMAFCAAVATWALCCCQELGYLILVFGIFFLLSIKSKQSYICHCQLKHRLRHCRHNARYKLNTDKSNNLQQLLTSRCELHNM